MDVFDLLFSGTESLNFNIAYWIGGTGVALGALCHFSHKAYSLIFKLWNFLIYFIDLCITWTTLPLFYYLLFTPFAFALRIFGKASMKKSSPQSSSFWKTIKNLHLSNNTFANFNYEKSRSKKF